MLVKFRTKRLVLAKFQRTACLLCLPVGTNEFEERIESLG